MTLLQKIKADHLTTRKDRNTLTATLLSTLIGESEAIGKNDGNREVADAEVVAKIKKFINGIDESLAVTSIEALRVGVLTTEKIVLQQYLPKQMNDVELRKAVTEIVEDMRGRASQVNMGMIMGALKNAFEGQYDGKMASAIIKEVI
jgi:uncharacterized protein YqeY